MNSGLASDQPPECRHVDPPIELTVEARAHGWRVDHYLCRLYPNYSRALLQKAIEQKTVLVNGLPVKAARRLRVNDRLTFHLPEQPDVSLPAEAIPLDILYEDESLVVINKRAGMIVHPGKGNYRGTLAGALQHHFDELSDAAGRYRPGIVHRLDRETSGLLVVAKNNQVHHRLSEQFEQRTVRKQYRALVTGNVELDSDFIDTHVRVHPKRREKMCVCRPGGNSRQAVTYYEVIERFDGFTYVKLEPKTGRTHQLRVHMQHLGHAIVADRLYGATARLCPADLFPGKSGFSGKPGPTEPDQHSEESYESSEVTVHGGRDDSPGDSTATSDADTDEFLIDRQALHAWRLEFRHPESGQSLSFEAPLPDDIVRTLGALRAIRAV